MATPITNLSPSVSSLYSTGLRPLIVEGIILRLLKVLFANPDNLLNETLRQDDNYTWHTDKNRAKIYIGPVYEWNINNLQTRPALVVKRNEWKVRQLGIGDGLNTSVDLTVDSETKPVGNPTLVVAVEGSTTIFCIAKLAAEVETLSTEIFIHLVQYAQKIRQDFGFQKFQVMQLGGLSKLDESDEYFIIPITVSYSATESWRLPIEAPLLKSFTNQTSIGS